MSASDRLDDWLSRPAGALAAYALMVGMSAVLWPNAWPAVSLAIGALWLAGPHRPLLLAACSLFFTAHIGWSLPRLASLVWGAAPAPTGIRVCLSASSVAFLLLLTLILQMGDRGLARLRRGLPWSAAALGVGVILALSASRGSPLLFSSVWVFAHFLFFFVAETAAPPAPAMGFVERLGRTFPFWSVVYFFPRNGDSRFTAKHDLSEPAQWGRLRREALVNLATACLLLTVSWRLSDAAGTAGQLPFHLAAAELGRLDTTRAWMAVLTSALLAALRWGMHAYALTGLIRATGYSLPPVIDAPWRATSFFDCWARIDTQLSRFLLNVFFLPLYTRLRGTAPALRLAAATALSVGAANFLLHYLTFLPWLWRHGPVHLAEQMFPYAIYCAQLALLLWASLAVESARRERGLAAAVAAPWMRALFIAYWVATGTLGIHSYVSTKPDEYRRFWSAMVGLGGPAHAGRIPDVAP